MDGTRQERSRSYSRLGFSTGNVRSEITSSDTEVTKSLMLSFSWSMTQLWNAIIEAENVNLHQADASSRGA